MIGVQELASDKNILAATNSYYFSYLKLHHNMKQNKISKKITDYDQRSFML